MKNLVTFLVLVMLGNSALCLPVVPANSAKKNALARTKSSEVTGIAGAESTVKNQNSSASIAKTVAKIPAAQSNSKWGLKLKNYNASYLDAIENNPNAKDYEFWAEEKLTLSYDFHEALRASITAEYDHTWFGQRNRPLDPRKVGYSQTYDGYWGNTALMLEFKELADFGSDTRLRGYLRYDLPTSEESQKAGSYGEIWGAARLSKKIGRLEMRWNEVLRYCLQEFTTSQITERKSSEYVQNLNYRIDSTLEFIFMPKEYFKFSIEMGFRNTVTWAEEVSGRAPVFKDRIFMNPQAAVVFSRNVELAVGIFESPDMRRLSPVGYVPLSAQNGGEGYLQLTVRL